MPDRDVSSLYIRWTAVRASFHRGWWLVTSLYLVVDAELSPLQLVLVGTAQQVIALVFEIPTGVLADTVSRKWSIVASHVLMGIGMLVTGLVTAFPALVVTQMVWGLAWTFSSGADVAWLTDELGEPERTGRVLTAAARWEQAGAAAGLVVLGAVGWAMDLSTAIVAAGGAMLLLGVVVAVTFPERNFRPVRDQRWAASRSIFRRGLELARGDREILLIFVATILVNGAADAYERLFPKRLLELGLPRDPDPIVWLTLLGLATLGVSVAALRIVEARIDGVGVARRVYVMACGVGALGLALLAAASDDRTGMAGVLLVGGIGWTVLRCVSVIWVNRRTTSDVRATVQSFLSQAEFVGEIALGLSLGVVAELADLPAAMAGGCALVVCAGGLVARVRG